MSQKTLLLVDGSSYLFRAFHALPDLRNKDNEPTGAIHGMVGMLRRLREDTRLHDGALYGAVIFDAPGRTFRDELFEQYKAQRTPMPDDLRAQLQPLLDCVEHMGLPLLRIEGVEVTATKAFDSAAENFRPISRVKTVFASDISIRCQVWQAVQKGSDARRAKIDERRRTLVR